MSAEPEPEGSGSPGSEDPEDLLAEMREQIKDLHDYDHRALALYGSSGHYLAMRIAGVPQPQAALAACEVHGHDAPRGLCLRCGLGVDLSAESDTSRDRVAKRAEWLQARR